MPKYFLSTLLSLLPKATHCSWRGGQISGRCQGSCLVKFCPDVHKRFMSCSIDIDGSAENTAGTATGGNNRPTVIAQKLDFAEIHAKKLLENMGKCFEIPVVSHGQNLRVNNIWLRENCQCPSCFDEWSQQRNVLFHEFDKNVEAIQMQLNPEQNSLQVTWSDGHLSNFNCSWLTQHVYPGQTYFGQKFFWNKKAIESVLPAGVDCKDLLEGPAGLTRLLGNLVKFGFGTVTNVDANESATNNVLEKVGAIQETMFGRVWTFTADKTRADTAYTALALGAHTDTTYLSKPAGIQAFHCLEHDGSGGETLLVDGFYCLNQLQDQHPTSFKVLSERDIIHRYMEGNLYNVLSLSSVFKIHPGTGEYIYLRYNPYDRAPINTIPQQVVGKYYSALRHLGAIIENPANQYWLKLRPGTVLFLDNWRVMHGRAAFTGRRVMCGAYLQHDDWMSKARLAGLA